MEGFGMENRVMGHYNKHEMLIKHVIISNNTSIIKLLLNILCFLIYFKIQLIYAFIKFHSFYVTLIIFKSAVISFSNP